MAIFLLIILATFQVTQGTSITGANTTPESPGGQRFDSVMGVDGALSILADAMAFVQLGFEYMSPDTPKKEIDTIHFTVDGMPGVAYAIGVEIHLSAQFVATFTGDLVFELRGVLYHEMTHIWQWFGKDGSRAPQGLIEGIADFMRLKAKLGVSTNGFVGLGSHWDEGYTVTALFLNYVNDLHPSFVAELNKKLYDGWSESYFQDLIRKSVDQLWSDFKQKFQ
ncbi:hypothetical protein SELMODRAFT_118618 [Selaginella moellendorffii]|uniref:Basic secretory protease n=1 Tax=Selaginella moellendorffii TaxID=88036 RepID=D8SJE4_SELML|nr:uncharacterized protein LOC9655095 [Selaginella moellendorffii]EFJ15437.1 hypothetical protein SELMODRAFT_118618 [Selaginella moellendorffii]|eukprot:XP_002983536.1 uncharacterized protein LOC9655095 [Selaginella moellendorffii]